MPHEVSQVFHFVRHLVRHFWDQNWDTDAKWYVPNGLTVFHRARHLVIYLLRHLPRKMTRNYPLPVSHKSSCPGEMNE